MNKFQLVIHNFFRFIWNAIFVISYPILATFGLLFVGLTYIFSWISQMLSKLNTSGFLETDKSGWEAVSQDSDVIEGKICKQIMFGPICYHFRRKDGIPSVLEDYVFGKQVRVIEEGWFIEKWNTTDITGIPDFDICLYQPEEDSLTKLATIKCFDWRLSEKEENNIYLQWFDGTKEGELKVSLST